MKFWGESEARFPNVSIGNNIGEWWTFRPAVHGFHNLVVDGAGRQGAGHIIMHERPGIHEEDFAGPALCFVDDEQRGLWGFDNAASHQPAWPGYLPRTEYDGLDQIRINEALPDSYFGGIIAAAGRLAIEHDNHATAVGKMRKQVLHPHPITILRGPPVNKTPETITAVDGLGNALVPHRVGDCQVEASKPAIGAGEGRVAQAGAWP